MHTVEYQRWNPPQSPVRVEFPPDLPAELANQGGPESQGVLYGILLGGDIRILSGNVDAGRMPIRAGLREGQPSGLGKIGIFIRHAEGEVFLSEPDLARFESQRAAVALVVAGDRAGFFVRQADGSIQSIRSHEEFTVKGIEADKGIEPVSKRIEAAPKPVDPRSRKSKPKNESRAMRKASSSRFPSFSLAALALLAIPLAAVAYFRPVTPPNAQLDTVALSWNAAATPRGATLEITDGANSTTVPVRPHQASLTYVPNGSRIGARLIASDGSSALLDAATLLFSVSPKTEPPAELRGQVDELETEAAGLRESLSVGHARVVNLQRTLAKLTRR